VSALAPALPAVAAADSAVPSASPPRNGGHHATVASPLVVGGELTSIDSRQLFANGNTLLIEHFGQRYTLRITRENKLILTK
jgi:hemin uptake protein HemP